MSDTATKAPLQLSDEQRQAIATEMDKRIKGLKCPMCGNERFSLLNGYTVNLLQFSLGGLQLGGPVVPCAAIACEKCGFVSQHALGVLGLLHAKAETK